jgi:hypothetical protein
MLKTLPLDVARCHGVRWGNEKDGEILSPCKTCKRRSQMAIDRPTDRVVRITPPLFDKGTCPSRIGE